MYRPRASEIRQKEFAEMSQEFEAAPLSNTVYEAILDDDQLTQLCDAAAEASIASDLRERSHDEESESAEKLHEAWGYLDYVARQRALEIVAESCATVIEHSEQWDEPNHWDDDAVANAQQEAREWMKAHTNETHRANVAEVLADGTD
jgi:hypothetical protein